MIDEKEELIGQIQSQEDLNGEIIASGEVIASMIAQKGGKGDTGAAGQDGYTPVKGVDYFTQEDIASLNIPTKTSDLTNNSGFISEETDPIFTSSDAYGITSTDISNWNSKSEFSGSYNDLTDKPTLFSGDYEDLTNKPTIPNELSDLSDDSTHRLVSDTEKSTWNNKSDFSGNYNDLTNKPSIPTKVSDLNNDSGFITNTANNLTNYYLKAETYTKTEVNNLISQLDEFKVEVVETLPVSDIDTHTIYLVAKTGTAPDVYDEYLYINNAWELIGNTAVDLTNYYTKSETDTLLNAKANSSDLATVATTGAYSDLSGTPTIPTKISDLTDDSDFIEKSNTAGLVKNDGTIDTTSYSTFSGSYNDLSNKPTIPTKTSDLTNDSGYMTGMTILAYGKSTWNDFITAYNSNKVVYCRASSNSNPATGSQTRMAFMAYVSNETTPTSVEFQYVRSISSHSSSQQGDQVYVYKLTNANSGTWSVETREMSTKIVPSTGLNGSYSSGTYTLTANIVTSLSSQSTDTQIPSAKCVYDLVGDIESLLSEV